jgi:uncharacterized protein with ParB-like and HNH nuclease domain
MINANKERLGAFFQGQLEYVVPFYQRSYVWEEDNWETFWDGIWSVFEKIRAGAANRAEHFIGTLITKQSPAERLGQNQYDIIDGQQRLTTVALLFKAMVQARNGDLPNLRGVLESLLHFDDAHGARHLRIIHSRIDTEYFEAIIRGADLGGLSNQEHKMLRAYKFFLNKTEDLTDQEINDLMTVVLSCVPVVSMLLAADDDEQVIFDTINSLGVKLTTAELLKNYVFKERELQALYESHWTPVFEASEEQVDFWGKDKTAGRIIRNNIEVLLYCYLVIKTMSEVRLETLFKEYKDWLHEKTAVERRDFLRELKEYAEIYFAFPSDEDLNEISFGDVEKRFFHVIENLEITTIYPLVLHLYKNVEDEGERHAMLSMLESYLVRRNVCRLTSKNYNNVFVEIIRALTKVVADEHRALTAQDLFTTLTAYDDDTNRFPDDATVADGFRTSSLSNKHAKEILYCIALKQKHNPHADVQRLSAQSLSVEHIMPKKWEEHWNEDELDEDEKIERNKKLRALGNLTLVTKRLNSKMQNAAWEDKKPVLRRHSSLEITTNYLNVEEWDENAIEDRGDDLLAVAQSIWPRE